VETNNEALLKMLKSTAGPAWAAVEKVLADFEKKDEKQKESLRKALLDGFKKKGISGSAIVPNLNADPQWLRVRSETRVQLQEEIRKIF
jgi:hypothetical protein